jgi:hypothetical protein
LSQIYFLLFASIFARTQCVACAVRSWRRGEGEGWRRRSVRDLSPCNFKLGQERRAALLSSLHDTSIGCSLGPGLLHTVPRTRCWPHSTLSLLVRACAFYFVFCDSPPSVPTFSATQNHDFIDIVAPGLGLALGTGDSRDSISSNGIWGA